MKGIELLAPARNLDCGIAAIQAGADAVYIGARQFGARSRASNTLDDIAALVEHAHTYWARVYVTVNTLLHDHEMPQAVALIYQLHAIGVDAVIVQDVGLLEQSLPPIALIASTQMHNHTPERVKFLEDVGFERVILARELSLNDIREIRARTSIELETFVHGALCVSYSGQCYLSYAVGGRSGNRGECAQPCRRRYTLVDREGRTLVEDKYLLSLKDLNLSAHLGDLLDAGVCSFKIEGRLKDKNYVSNVVSAYRQHLDTALEARGMARSSSGSSRLAFTPDLGKTFNRDYTTYFLTGRGESPGSIDTPKMTGEKLGPVVAVGPRTFTLKTESELHNGDGICFFGPDGVLQGTVVNGARIGTQGVVVTPNEMDDIEPGTVIYRNRDHAFLQTIERHPPDRSIAVDFSLNDSRNGFVLGVMDEDANTAWVEIDVEKTPARKPDEALENARRQLAKTGGTAFTCRSVQIDWSQPYFLPYSTLNELRRRALARLTAVRSESRPVMQSSIVPNETPYPNRTLSYRGNVLNEAAELFYYRHGVDEIEPAAESGLNMSGKIVMTTRYCIKRQLGWCPRQENAPPLLEPLVLVDEDGRRYQLRFRCQDGLDRCTMQIVA
jgi:putative protease